MTGAVAVAETKPPSAIMSTPPFDGRFHSFPVFPTRMIRRGSRCGTREEWNSSGERLSNRISTGAAGRRGRFPQGRNLPDNAPSPLRKMHRAGTPTGGPEGRC